MAPCQLPPGDLIAQRFAIEGVAGEGGMGTVFRALDRATGGLVAVKLLRQDRDAHEPDRFVREAQVLAELRHPGIVSYVAHGHTAEGRPFLAMEWLPGEDLARRLRRGPLPLRAAMSLLTRVAAALSAAHSRGIVHRDLKPSNIFLRDGQPDQPVIMDFGVARRLLGPPITRSGCLLGTPGYMSPEQARGERQLDTSADIFSLGCVLYECLAGQPPFQGEHLPALLAKVLFEQARPVRQLRSAVPAAWEALLDRMLAKNAEARPQDAEGLACALRALPPAEEDGAGQAAPAPARPALTGAEQQLVSVVMASPDAVSPVPGETLSALDQEQRRLRHDSLRAALASFGARLEWLADGSLLVTLSPISGAADHAVLAARCALLIKERWPEARVALTTGRGVLDGPWPIGEAIDRAAALLRRPASTPAPGPGSSSDGVWLDVVSAGLLDVRFQIVEREGDALLRGELVSPDESRPLLGRPTPCLGREQELQLLDSAFTACGEEEEARAITVIAPPGAGKSRLRHEFLRRLSAQNAAVEVLLGRGDPISTGSPFGLLRKTLLHFAGIQDGRLAEQGAVLHDRLAEHLPAPERHRVALFLCELCGAPAAEETAALRAARGDPKLMNEQVQQAFLDWLRALCARRTVLLVLEDLHWGDQLTILLIERALRELFRCPLLVLALARPEIRQLSPRLWTGPGQEIMLRGLSRKAGERLVRDVLADRLPDAQTVARIVEQSDGNPLFLEELIRTVAEGKTDGAPATVLALLQARLSRLDAAARRVLRAASIFGETFWVGGLQALSPAGPEAGDLDRWLEVLTEAELIQRRRDSHLPEEAEYAFRHALVREAAYSLLVEQDRVLGHRIASAYLEERGEQDAMVLAEHAHRGLDLGRASALYVRAAEQSFARGDLPGVLLRCERGIACGAVGQALGQIRALQASAETWREEWTAALTLGMEALDLLPQGSPHWLQAIQYLFVIAGNHSDPAPMQQLTERFSALLPARCEPMAYLLAASYPVVMFSLVGLRKLARLFLDRMRQASAMLGESDALDGGRTSFSESWFYYMLEPEPYLAQARAEQAARILTEVGDRRLLCVQLFVLGLAQIALGNAGDGERTLRDAVVLARQTQEAFNVSMAELYLMLGLAEAPGRLDEAAELAASLLGNERNARGIFLGSAHGVRTRHLLQQRRYAEADTAAREAQEQLRPMPPYRVPVMTSMVHGLLAQGRCAEALQLAEEAMAIVEACGGLGSCEVAARVAAAEARNACGDVPGARAALREALAQLDRRVSTIPDAAAQERFLTAVPGNIRARELARTYPP